MEDLRQILDDHEANIQTILFHKRKDFEKRHMIWKHNCSEWQRDGKKGIPYPEPQMYPEYLIRRNNMIHFNAIDLENIYKEIAKKLSSI